MSQNKKRTNKKRTSKVRAMSTGNTLASSYERDAVRKKSPKNSDSAAAAQKKEDSSASSRGSSRAEGDDAAAAQQPTPLNIRKSKREARSHSVDSVPHSFFKSWGDELPKLKQTRSPRRGKKFASSVESLPDSQKCYLPANSKGKVTGSLFCLQPPLYPEIMSSTESIGFGITSDSNSDDGVRFASVPSSPAKPKRISKPEE